MKVISTGRGGGLRRLFLFTVFLVIVLAVTGWFVVRTAGFRQLAGERLSLWSGLPLRVESSAIGWPYALVLRGVRTPPSAEGVAVQLDLREVHLSRSWRFWRVRVRGGELRLPADAAWRPAGEVPAWVARVAALQDAGALELMRATTALRRGWAIHLQDMDLLWVAAPEQVEARVPQLAFQMEPVRLPSGRVTYYLLAIAGQADGALGNVRDMRWEWLSRRDGDYIEIVRQGIHDQGWPDGGSGGGANHAYD